MNKDFIKATFKDGDFSIDINISLEEETIWMTQKEIASVFEVTIGTINTGLKKTKNSDSTFQFYQIVQQENGRNVTRNVKIYNLEIITLLSYKVRSKRAPTFISWANKTIEELKAKQEREINESYDNVLHSNKYEIVNYNDGDFAIQVKVDSNAKTAWLTIDQIAVIYRRSRSVISKHIKNIFKEGELNPNSVCAKNAHTASDGKKYEVVFYNLQMLLAVGYRVKSENGIRFRNWASKIIENHFNDTNLFSNKDEYLLYSLLKELIDLKDDVRLLKNVVITPEFTLIKSGQYFEATVLLKFIMKFANESMILIDPYLDFSILNYVNETDEHVAWIFVASSKSLSKLQNHLLNINRNLKYICDDSNHDRFIIIDKKILFHVGSSINYLGKKETMISRVEDKEFCSNYITNVINKYWNKIK